MSLLRALLFATVLKSAKVTKEIAFSPKSPYSNWLKPTGNNPPNYQEHYSVDSFHGHSTSMISFVLGRGVYVYLEFSNENIYIPMSEMVVILALPLCSPFRASPIYIGLSRKPTQNHTQIVYSSRTLFEG